MALPIIVLFDLDGTLIDTAPAIVLAMNQLLGRRGRPPVDLAKVRSLLSYGASELLTGCLASIPGEMDSDLSQFRSIYGSLRPDAADVYPGVRETLGWLVQNGVRLGICTNKPQGLADAVLEGVGLRSFLSVVIGGDSVRHPKPHPDHLQEALDRLGSSARQAVYVGDSEIDSAAAKAACVPFVFVRYGYPIGDPDKVECAARIDGLGGLPDILLQLANRPPRDPRTERFNW